MDEIQPMVQPKPEPPAEERTEAKLRLGQIVMDVIETVALAVLLFLGINAISARVRVDGFSMQPTLQDSEFVLVNRLAYRFGSIQRGDIIVFHLPRDPKQELIKRVIGLPGDSVVVKSGTVTVNGQALAEPYIAAAPIYAGEWRVPTGYIFVLGDNRNDSSDSHAWGMLPIVNVVGKAILIYWPPPDWNVIQHADLLTAVAR